MNEAPSRRAPAIGRRGTDPLRAGAETAGGEPDGDESSRIRPASFLMAALRHADRRLTTWTPVIMVAVIALGRISIIGAEKRYPFPPHHEQAVVLSEVVMCASVLVAVLMADEAVARGARRWATYFGAVLGACLAGAYVQYRLLIQLDWDSEFTHSHDHWAGFTQPLGVFLPARLYGSLACFVYVKLRSARLAADRMRAAELARANSRRRTLESQLQAMQARVEPQFLFNTLHQVRELYERDAVTAGRMLEDLIAYLRAALPQLRDSHSTLGQEATLARAYLDIMRIRLGERLKFEVDVPGSTERVRMPPMMLLPLIDHALACDRAQGSGGIAIHMAAELREGRLRLAIADGGDAFRPDARSPGLEGIGMRLRGLYGDGARFVQERLPGSGTRAILEIPHEQTDGSDR